MHSFQSAQLKLNWESKKGMETVTEYFLLAWDWNKHKLLTSISLRRNKARLSVGISKLTSLKIYTSW